MTPIAPKYGSRELRDFEIKRFEELSFRFKQITGVKYDGRIVNQKTKETLMDIACSKGRFEEVSKWQLQKLKEKEKEQKDINKSEVNTEEIMNTLVKMFLSGEINELEQIDIQINTDMTEAEKIYKEAFDLMKSRNEKYGDSWKVLSIQSLANLCEMKLHRIANLDKIEPKIYDELIDVLNYMVFGILKFKRNIGIEKN